MYCTDDPRCPKIFFLKTHVNRHCKKTKFPSATVTLIRNNSVSEYKSNFHLQNKRIFNDGFEQESESNLLSSVPMPCTFHYVGLRTFACAHIKAFGLITFGHGSESQVECESVCFSLFVSFAAVKLYACDRQKFSSTETCNYAYKRDHVHHWLWRILDAAYRIFIQWFRISLFSASFDVYKWLLCGNLSSTTWNYLHVQSGILQFLKWGQNVLSQNLQHSVTWGWMLNLLLRIFSVFAWLCNNSLEMHSHLGALWCKECWNISWGTISF